MRLGNVIHTCVWLREYVEFWPCLFFTADSKIPASPNVIVAHPDFRMVVLANRPGFPFLGNDFFGAMGEFEKLSEEISDAFTVYVIFSIKFKEYCAG